MGEGSGIYGETTTVTVAAVKRPGPTSGGDETKDDGVFSFRIPIYGQGFTEPGFQTKAGRFLWRFAAQDLLNDYTNIVEHEIIIQ